MRRRRFSEARIGLVPFAFRSLNSFWPGPCPRLRVWAAPTPSNCVALATPNPRREQVLETSALKGFAQNQFERESVF